MWRNFLIRGIWLALLTLLIVVELPLIVSWGRDVLSRHRPPQPTIISPTKMATCYDEITGKVTGTMLVRRPVMVSPDGREQAYAVIEAVSNGGGCESTSKLFVKRAGEKKFHLVLVEKPEEQELLNDIRLIDWSQDGRYLLIDLVIGQWGSDAGGIVPMVYDARRGAFWPRYKVRDALDARAGCICDFYVESAGFAPDDGVVLRIRSVFEIEGPLAQDSCVKKPGLWLLKNTLVPLPDDYKVRHYGRLLAAPVK
jgi:hypothetical protein